MFLKNMSHYKKCTFWYCVVNEEVPLTSSQIVEQIEVIQEVILLRISNMNDSALDKKQDLTQFFHKKEYRKRKMILPIIFTIATVDGSCYRVMNSSILQEFFPSVSKFLTY